MKKMLLVFLSFVVVFSLCSFTNGEFDYEKIEEEEIELMKLADEELKKNSSSLEIETMNQIKEIEKEIENEKNDKKIKELRKELNINKKILSFIQNGYKQNLIESKGLEVGPEESLNPFLDIATLSAATYYLKSKGYVLAAELFRYSWKSHTEDSCYKPENWEVIKKTNEYKEILNENNKLFFDKEFQDDGSIEGMDAHLALKKVLCNKTIGNTGIVISDRYDFDFDLDGYKQVFVGVGNNVMAYLQRTSFITPYNVIIEISENKDTNYSVAPKRIEMRNYNVYIEETGIIGAGEYLKYELLVTADVNKTIQTFGPDDTEIEMYDSLGNFVAYDDNSGYENNACVCPYLTKDRTYCITVRFKSPDAVGNIRVGFSSTVSTNFDDNERIERVDDEYDVLSLFSYKYLAKLFVINNETNCHYCFEIKKSNFKRGTQIIMIDPRRSDYYTPDNNSDSPALYKKAINYSGGARLECKKDFFAADSDFILIVSPYILSETGNYELKTKTSIIGLFI